MLGAAAEAGGLHVGELLVGVRADPVAEELERAAAGDLEDRADPCRGPAERPTTAAGRRARRRVVMHREPRDAERVEPRRDRHRLLPVRAAQAAGEVELFDEQPVGDDLVVRRRRDDELAGRLVVRVVDHRQPLARVVRPVLAERGPLAVDVVDEPQPAGRDAAVCRRARDFGAGRRPAAPA